MTKIDAPDAWNISTGSQSVVVAVIDTGVDYTHPDLAANIWTNPGEIAGNGRDDDGNGFVDDVHGYDFAEHDGDPMDDNGHGTHVAGTIAAVGNNGLGVAGVNWSASIMPLKFLNSQGPGYLSDAIRAINYATMERTRYGVNVRVMNNSWGGGGFSSAMQTAIQAASDAGILFVAAAGNSGTNNDASPHYPANYTLAQRDLRGGQRPERPPGQLQLLRRHDRRHRRAGRVDLQHGSGQPLRDLFRHEHGHAVRGGRGRAGLGGRPQRLGGRHPQRHPPRRRSRGGAERQSGHRRTARRLQHPETAGYDDSAKAARTVPPTVPSTPSRTTPAASQGLDTIGLYTPGTSVFNLKNTNDGTSANATFAYTPATGNWVSIVGDWNGDGKDTVGLYDVTTSRFYLRNTNDSGTANVAFAFGPANSGWQPVVGDWDGDGKDTIGLYDPDHVHLLLAEQQ